MKLEGIHHVTAITGNAPQNVDFYADTLGLRLVKKTVNFDAPSAYHLYYGDEAGSPGSLMTFFPWGKVTGGHAGAGMVHRVLWRVGSEESLDFWAERLGIERDGDTLLFADPEGLEHELLVDTSGEEPLIAEHPEIPREHALRGFAGVRAYATDPDRSSEFLQKLGFEPGWVARGEKRSGTYVYDRAPEAAPFPGAGTVHHVAWASPIEDHEQWRERVLQAGGRPTPIIERFYFKSIYFREPNGILFEIATLGPGFTADEPLEHLGERLSLPPAFEPLRAQVEPVLTPIRNPRDSWVKA
jgi:glyoxalase family protein